MAILKKSKIGSKLMTIIVVVALLAVGVPLVSAYEAHTINVKAYVKDWGNLDKTIRLATWEEIVDSGISFPSPPHGSENLTPLGYDAYNVPIETCVVWVVRISFLNPTTENITNVTIKDNFSAEMATGEPLDSMPVDLTWKEHTRGKSKKESFITQYRILWYVTYDGPFPFPDDPEFDPEEFNTLIMGPGDSEFLELYVWTKKNPSGKQSYTSPGDYTLNSGPTAKWLVYPDGPQFSYDYLPVYITAWE